MAEAVVELPDSLRGELKEPLGPVYTDAGDLLDDASGPIVAVGDIVTYHLLSAGYFPRVALVDGKTERERVDREVFVAGGFSTSSRWSNPSMASKISRSMRSRSVLPSTSATVGECPADSRW